MIDWLAAGILTVACAVSAGAAPPKNPGTYVEVDGATVSSIDPAGGHFAIPNIYETLFGMEAGSFRRFEPLLASAVPSAENGRISSDGRVYRIPLERRAVFSDGRPFTAEDARYSLLRFLLIDPDDSGYSHLLLRPLLGIDSVHTAGRLLPDAYARAAKAVTIEGGELVLRLPRPYVPLISVLSFLVPMRSKSWCIEQDEWNGEESTLADFAGRPESQSHLRERALGTGPFLLERWDRGERVTVLRRNDRYWRSAPRLERAVIRGVPEFGTRKLMLQAGDADAIAVDLAQTTQLKDMPGVMVQDDLPSLAVGPLIFFNQSISAAANRFIGSGALDGNGIPPRFFADAHVRRGFALAFDQEALRRDVYGGKGRRGTGFLPDGMLGASHVEPTYAFDPKAAERELRRALGGALWREGFQLVIAYNSSSAANQYIASILKNGLERLNPRFKIETQALDWTTLGGAMGSRTLPLYIGSCSPEFPDPHTYAFHLFHSKGAFTRFGGYGDRAYDALVDQAAAESAPDARARIYGELRSRLMRDIPFFVTIQAPRARAQRAWVKGWNANPLLPNGADGLDLYPLYKVDPDRK